MKKRIKVNGTIISLVVVLLIAFPHLFFRSRISLAQEIFKAIGLFLVLLGQNLRISSRGFKAEFSKMGFALVCNGPYKLVRNPMYLGILLIGVGISLILFQWWVVILFLAVFLSRYLFLTLSEEEKLENMFKEEYRQYKLAVPRIFPSPAVLLKKEISDFLPMKLSWLKKEIGSAIAVLSGIVILEFFVNLKNAPLEYRIMEITGLLVMLLFFVFLNVYLMEKTKKCSK